MASAAKAKPFNFMWKRKRGIITSESITSPIKYEVGTPLGQKSRFSKRKSMVKRRTSISLADHQCLEDKTNKLPW
jgi:hypothetical protein